MSKVDTVKSKWEEKKPIAFAFALGLVLGPFISNMIGWQVTNGSLERRVRAAAFEPGDIAGVKARAFHFGPLTRGDLPVSLIEAAADTGAYVALGVQGFLRVVRDGEVVAVPWPDLRESLRRVDTCQGDVEETCLLAGESEVFRAMANLAEMGPREVLTTEGGHGSYLFWRGRMVKIPSLAPPRVVDATGCGVCACCQAVVSAAGCGCCGDDCQTWGYAAAAFAVCAADRKSVV